MYTFPLRKSLQGSHRFNPKLCSFAFGKNKNMPPQCRARCTLKTMAAPYNYFGGYNFSKYYGAAYSLHGKPEESLLLTVTNPRNGLNCSMVILRLSGKN